MFFAETKLASVFANQLFIYINIDIGSGLTVTNVATNNMTSPSIPGGLRDSRYAINNK